MASATTPAAGTAQTSLRWWCATAASPVAVPTASLAVALQQAARRWHAGEQAQAAFTAVAAGRDALEAELCQRLTGVRVLGAGQRRLPHISCLHLDDCSAEAVHMALDIRGFAVSTGSACSAGTAKPSPILMGMGLTEAEARQCIRLSLGSVLHADAQAQLVQALVEVVTSVRQSGG